MLVKILGFTIMWSQMSCDIIMNYYDRMQDTEGRMNKKSLQSGISTNSSLMKKYQSRKSSPNVLDTKY